MVRTGARRASALLTTVVLGIGLAACVIVSDDDDTTVLGIELFWDDIPASDTFYGGTCYSAGVERMTWSLEAEDGFAVADGDDDPCRDRIEVEDIQPGNYTLHISGFDDEGALGWRTECTNLIVGRFDELYGCDIRSTTDTGDGDGDAPDGGTPDAG